MARFGKILLAVILVFLLHSCFGYSKKVGDFKYRAAGGWGTFDGLSYKAKLKSPYWLWIPETYDSPRLMYGPAGTGLPKGPNLESLGVSKRYMVAKLSDETWYIFDHGDASWDKWVQPEGPFTRLEVKARVHTLPDMRSTAHAGEVVVTESND